MRKYAITRYRSTKNSSYVHEFRSNAYVLEVQVKERSTVEGRITQAVWNVTQPCRTPLALLLSTLTLTSEQSLVESRQLRCWEVAAGATIADHCMANRRPGSIGSGSTGSTSRSLDPKAQRDVDALLGISRRDPPRDKNRDKSREKVRDAQPSEQPREHGRSILGSSLFKRSAKKDKQTSTALWLW